MNRHLSFRSGNPALTKNTFKNISDSSVNKMTLEGTVNKTIIALILLLFFSGFSIKFLYCSILKESLIDIPICHAIAFIFVKYFTNPTII